MILLKIIASLLISALVALAFGILPCYIFPYFGGATTTWCGSRSEPPYFFVQCAIGFGVGMGIALLFFLKKKR
jgi:hypothetical protein